MYLLLIKRNPKSIIRNVNAGFLINFLKEAPYIFKNEVNKNKKESYKVEIEKFHLNNDNNLKLLQKLSLG